MAPKKRRMSITPPTMPSMNSTFAPHGSVTSCVPRTDMFAGGLNGPLPERLDEERSGRRTAPPRPSASCGGSGCAPAPATVSRYDTLGCSNVDVDVEAVAEALPGEFEVQFALPAEERLPEVRVHRDGEARVFLVERVQALREPVFLALTSLACTATTCRGAGKWISSATAPARPRAERVVRVRVLELDGRAEVAREERFHRLAVLAVHRVELPEALARARLRVFEVLAGR